MKPVLNKDMYTLQGVQIYTFEAGEDIPDEENIVPLKNLALVT